MHGLFERDSCSFGREISRLCGNRDAGTMFTSTHRWTLLRATWIQFIPSHNEALISTAVVPSHVNLDPRKWSASLRVSHKNSVCSVLVMRSTCHRCVILYRLVVSANSLKHFNLSANFWVVSVFLLNGTGELDPGSAVILAWEGWQHINRGITLSAHFLQQASAQNCYQRTLYGPFFDFVSFCMNRDVVSKLHSYAQTLNDCLSKQRSWYINHKTIEGLVGAQVKRIFIITLWLRIRWICDICQPVRGCPSWLDVE